MARARSDETVWLPANASKDLGIADLRLPGVDGGAGVRSASLDHPHLVFERVADRLAAA